MDGFLFFGVSRLYCLDENLSVLLEKKLGETAQETVQTFQRLRQGIKDPIVADFLKTVEKKGISRLFVEAKLFAEEFSTLYEVKAVHYEDTSVWRKVRQNLGKLTSNQESRTLLHDIALGITQRGIREASEQNDQLIIQAMSSLDDVEKVQNLMGSRLREWYGLHFPEAAQAIENASTLAQLVLQGGQRESIATNPDLIPLLAAIPIKPELLTQSMGAAISQQDMGMIQGLAKQYLDLQEFREKLERYLDESMLEVAPNLRGLIGAVIGARLIAIAGGIEKLARLPASTVQVLGAEQAMFRALKTGARPPKHGVIFQHTLIHSAPWWQRGKIARVLSGKIAIAARIDLFSGEYVADELKQNVLTRIAEIRRKYSTAPKPPPSTKPAKRPPRQRRYTKQKARSPKKTRSQGRRQKN